MAASTSTCRVTPPACLFVTGFCCVAPTAFDFVMPAAPASRVLVIVGVSHHAYLSKQLSFSPSCFTCNEIGIGESVETKPKVTGWQNWYLGLSSSECIAEPLTLAFMTALMEGGREDCDNIATGPVTTSPFSHQPHPCTQVPCPPQETRSQRFDCF